MSNTIKRITVRDIRFPTSRELHGSDAMNPNPDYSAAYVTLETDSELRGNGIAFTLGRGTELCVLAAERIGARLLNQDLDVITRSMARVWRHLASDSQMRWVGPEKGVVHMALAAVVNAVWDLWAKSESKPLWKLLCDLSPEEIVECIDFRYIGDAITPDEATSILRNAQPTRHEREALVRRIGYPAYTTSAGWLGYSDEMIQQLCERAIEDGWTHFKIKVGADLGQDIHRLDLVRNTIGSERGLMLDANQVWDVDEAIAWMSELSRFDPYWIEEPTSPDDVLGHARIAKAIAPVRVATGEMCQNRVIFKQLFQADAIGFCQVDSCRLGGVNEVLAVILMAAKYGIPVCPHGGGVGLCEHIQHLSLFDFICVSQSLQNRYAEYVDHLHEHFVDPVRVQGGRYLVPTLPGYSIQMHQRSLDDYEYPNGPVWRDIEESARRSPRDQ
jgi:L-fuconate dehydratase